MLIVGFYGSRVRRSWPGAAFRIVALGACGALLAVASLPRGVFAHGSPPGCFVNDLDTDISIPPLFTGGAPCGTAVPFTVTVSNGASAGACDVTDAPVTFTCPDPLTGAPTGPVTTLAAGDDFTAAPPSSTTYPSVPCVIGDATSGTCVCGAPIYQGQAEAGPGILHLNPLDIDIARVLKTLSVPCIGQPPLRHYQCFELKPRLIGSPAVSLVDQFGTSSARLRKPDRVCNPTNKNGGDPTAPSDPNHLVGYNIRAADSPFLPVDNLMVTNQFGTLRLDLGRLVRLLVPAAKSLTAPPDPLTPPGIDHFACYAVRPSRGAPAFRPVRNVTVADQFGSAVVDVIRPLSLCAPASKNGESPGAESHPGHLLCYETVHPRERIDIAPVFVNDQFGARAERVIRRDELCLPSTKLR